MTTNQAARKFNVGPARIRALLRDGRIRGAKWRTDVPQPYWEIPDDLEKLPTLDGPGAPGRNRPAPRRFPVQGLPTPPAAGRSKR